MFWEEKIDSLKKRYSSTEFKDPFRSGFSIVEKILQAFFVTTKRDKINASEAIETLIKDVQQVKIGTFKEFYASEIQKLGADKRYWLLLFKLSGGGNLFVYDVTIKPLCELIYLTSGNPKNCFCIVDKKYEWLIYVEIEASDNTVKVFRSDKTAPFSTIQNDLI